MKGCFAIVSEKFATSRVSTDDGSSDPLSSAKAGSTHAATANATMAQWIQTLEIAMRVRSLWWFFTETSKVSIYIEFSRRRWATWRFENARILKKASNRGLFINEYKIDTFHRMMCELIIWVFGVLCGYLICYERRCTWVNTQIPRFHCTVIRTQKKEH